MNFATKYTDEQNKWLKENFNNYETLKELAKEFNLYFNSNRSVDGIRKKLNENNLKMNNRTKYTKIQENWIKENKEKYKTLKLLSKEFNSIFDCNISYKTFKTKVERLGIKNNNYRYSEEQKQWIKDNYKNYILEYEYDKERFLIDFERKFNHKILKRDVIKLIRYITKDDNFKFNPKIINSKRKHKQTPILSETTNYNNDIYVKIKDDSFIKNRFELGGNYRKKANIMYEEYHNVKVDDEKDCIIFLNGNKNDFSKDNLYLVSKDINTIYKRKYNCQKIFITNEQINRIALMTIQLENILKQRKDKSKE